MIVGSRTGLEPVQKRPPIDNSRTHDDHVTNSKGSKLLPIQLSEFYFIAVNDLGPR